MLKNDEESIKTYENKTKSLSPIKTNVLEPETLSCTDSGSLSSSNCNLSNNALLKDVDSSGK